MFVRRIFVFNDKMYNVSSHYFRLFKQSNLHLLLFDSKIQNLVKKTIFQINLKRELNNFDLKKRFFFSNIKKTFVIIIDYKIRRQFRFANSNRRIIIHMFQKIDQIIILHIIDNSIDSFRKHQIKNFTNLKIKMN